MAARLLEKETLSEKEFRELIREHGGGAHRPQRPHQRSLTRRRGDASPDKEETMKRKLERAMTAVGGACVGAALLYTLDVQARRPPPREAARQGAPRREAGRIGHGPGGLRHRRPQPRHPPPPARSSSRPKAVDDRILAERVRSKMGRYVSHPHSIGVLVQDGKVTLAGPIVAGEAAGLLDHVRRIPGVKGVEDALHPHEKSAGVPGLQGGQLRKGERAEILQANWSPAYRFGAAALGSVLMARGAMRKGLKGWSAAAAGAGLLARAWYNEPLSRIFGLGGGPAAIRLQKTVNIDALPDLVFRIFASYDNFPLYMPHVKEVKDLGEGRSHWKVQALPGTSVEWDAEITELVADRSLGWTSLEGALVPNAGIIRFSPNSKAAPRWTSRWATILPRAR